MSKLSNVLAVISVLVLSWQGSPCLAAKDRNNEGNRERIAPWIQERNAATMLDSQGDFAAAIPRYQRALALLPQADVNTVIELKCQIAGDYLRQGDIARARPIVSQILGLAKPRRQEGLLSPDAGLALRSLVEECETGSLGKYRTHAEGLKIFSERMVFAEGICDSVLPEARSPNHIVFVARGYLGFGDQIGALKYIEHAAARVRRGDPDLPALQIKVAALKNFIKQPAALAAVTANLRRTKSYVAVASEIACAQTWATDYPGSRATAEAALKKMEGDKSVSRVEKLNLLQVYLGNLVESGRWVEGEKVALQALVLQPEHEMRFRFMEDLHMCLEKQNKMKEAAQLKKSMPHSKFDFLEDEERSVSDEIERKHSGSKNSR